MNHKILNDKQDGDNMNMGIELDDLENEKKFNSDNNNNNNNNNNDNINNNDRSGIKANRRVIIDKNDSISNPNDVEIAKLKGMIS